MRLLFLTQVLDEEDPILGFTHDWVAALAERTDGVVVVAGRVGAHRFDGSVVVRSLGKEENLGRAARLRRFLGHVRAGLGDEGADVVFAHMVPRLALAAAPLARAARVPLFLWYTHKGVDWSLRAAARVVEAIFTASDRSLRLQTPKKRIVGHGIALRRFRPGEGERRFDAVSVGRIAPAKDPLTIVRALGRLRRAGRRLRFAFAGGTLLSADDAYQARLRAEIGRLGLEEDVVFLGAVPYPRVAEVYASSRAFCLPSRTGSVDKALLEAMACGLAPITSNESLVDVLGAEAGRFLFEAGDDRALAERLAQWLDLSEEERRSIGARMRAVVERSHSLDRLADRLVAEIGERLALGRGR